MSLNHIICVCYNGITRPWVADGGGGLQLWKVAANMLNKQSRTGDKESSSLGGGGARCGSNKSSW
jgi:hypothetical protein